MTTAAGGVRSTVKPTVALRDASVLPAVSMPHSTTWYDASARPSTVQVAVVPLPPVSTPSHASMTTSSFDSITALKPRTRSFACTLTMIVEVLVNEGGWLVITVAGGTVSTVTFTWAGLRSRF